MKRITILIIAVLLLAPAALADHGRRGDAYDDRDRPRKAGPTFYDERGVHDGRLIRLAARVERSTDLIRNRAARRARPYHPAGRGALDSVARLERNADRFLRSVQRSQNPLRSRDEFLSLRRAFHRADRTLDRMRLDRRTRREIAELRFEMKQLSRAFDARLQARYDRRAPRRGPGAPRAVARGF